MRVGLEGGSGLPQRFRLELIHVGAWPQVRCVDPRPVEFREPGDLVGVGVGQRERVAAAAVERALQMQHPGPEVRVEATGLVEPALPVECHLERILDGQRAAVDEEQVRQRGVPEHPRERVDEARHRHGVDVGVARLVHGHRRQFGQEFGVVGQCGMVHAQRGRGEEREHVQVAPTGSGRPPGRSRGTVAGRARGPCRRPGCCGPARRGRRPVPFRWHAQRWHYSKLRHDGHLIVKYPSKACPQQDYFPSHSHGARRSAQRQFEPLAAPRASIDRHIPCQMALVPELFRYISPVVVEDL